jgi:hypothetical protein
VYLAGESNTGNDLLDVVERHFEVAMKGVHTAFPARIVSYEHPNKASIKSVFKLQFKTSERPEEYATISDIPIVLPRSSGSIDFYPLKAGDYGLAIVTEESMSEWVNGGGDAVFAKDRKRFDMSSAFFIPGAYPFGNNWSGEIPEGRGSLITEDTGFHFGNNKPMILNGGTEEFLNIFKILAEFVELLNNAHTGISTAPVPLITTNIAELKEAIANLTA